MDGQIEAGWYIHPQLGLIKIYTDETNSWNYRCYSDSGARALSKERPLDQWTWALCEEKEIIT